MPNYGIKLWVSADFKSGQGKGVSMTVARLPNHSVTRGTTNFVFPEKKESPWGGLGIQDFTK